MDASQLVRDGASRLEAAGVPEAQVKAEWWVSESLGIRRDEIPGARADEKQCASVEAGFGRLERHEPLQHVIGHTPFLNAELLTDARALVPRPETEELASMVLACDDLWAKPLVRMADIGTGSGCLAIAIAMNRQNARVEAVDISGDALELARASSERNGVGDRIAFRRGDLLEGFEPGSLDAVVSNPPYVASRVIGGLERSVRDFEPRSALDGGEDGLDTLRRLIPQAFTALANGGRLWLEIGDEQGSAVNDMLTAAGFRHVAIRLDMYGRTRFAEAIT